MISSLTFYLVPVVISKYENYIIEKEMNKFDLNNDGFFSLNEMNPELEKLQLKYISDSGANLFLLYGFPICLIYSIITSLFYFLFLTFLT